MNVGNADLPPPVQDGPPWSFAFVAALHAGCYDDDDGRTRRLVLADPDGRRMLGQLDEVVSLLAAAGRRRVSGLHEEY